MSMWEVSQNRPETIVCRQETAIWGYSNGLRNTHATSNTKTNSGDKITKNSPKNNHLQNWRIIGNLECHNLWTYRFETFCWCIHLSRWFLLVGADCHHSPPSSNINNIQLVKSSNCTPTPQAADPPKLLVY